MRKILLLSVFLFFISAPTADAAIVTVNNYFYAHTNTPGTFAFRDKYGNTQLYGDGYEFDAVIVSIDVEAQGMGPGDTITARSSGGQTWTVTPGTTTNVNVAPNQTISITLQKSGYNEVWARLAVMRTYDASGGGTNVTYYFSLNDMPTRYGDLGPGSGGGGDVEIVQGNYYYFPDRDAYKYDYNPPQGVSYYELHYIDSNGNTLYMKEYQHAPTGVHYLTCNGLYEMRFYNASGGLVAKSPVMTTTQIQNPSCSSYAGTGAGFNDFSVQKTANPDGSVSLSWDPVPGAAMYEVWKDGQKIGETSDTHYNLPSDGSVSVIAKDAAGQIVGQTDLTPTGSGGSGGCNGCQYLQDILACPAWGDYMGQWESLLRSVIPPPPDWQHVANIMRDTIVPAMGQEIVNRMPEIARIIADEFERREDPVYPPGSIPTYSHPLPTMTDMPNRISFDLDSGVPSFEPDYSGSQPFVIPDPADIQLSDEDAGYAPPDPTPTSSNPPYQGTDPEPDPDPGYSGSAPPGDEISAPGYVITNPDVTDPGREYEIIDVDEGTMPGYQGGNEDPDGIPDYQTTERPMPDYVITE